MADRFYIGPYDSQSGQDTSVRPFLIPDNAFETMTNAYVFRGRVRKRFGSRWFGNTQQESRLRMTIGVVGGALVIPLGATQLAIGQMFSINTDVFYIFQLGANVLTLSTNPAITVTINTTVNPNTVVVAGGVALTTVYWYPGLPVMGLLTREVTGTNNEQIIGFDTRFAYQYLSTPQGWERLATEATPGASVWTGSNSQFFWGTNWLGANPQDLVLFVTNFNENEPNFMRFLFGNTWDNFRPQINATQFLNSARILVTFKNRLVALNTWEGAGSPGVNFPYRARYSGVGSPLAANAWREDIPGNGNAIDAPTTEAIITAEFVKDRLIVFFERSTWELVYTGNQIYPFAWQQINTELGVESTFSVVPFDKVALGVGNVGIHACNGANVERIDQKIPDSVFAIHNANQGVERVYGVRDYTVEMVYWTFPGVDTTAEFPFPNRVLIYNYTTGTWAFNQDSITVFGYFQPQTGITWDSTTVTWDSDISWDSGSLQGQFRQVVAGNQEGYTFIIEPDDMPTNASVLQITNIATTQISINNTLITITAINHNLRQGEFVYLSGIVDAGGADNLTLLNDKIFKITSDGINTGTPNTFQFIYEDDVGNVISGTYRGGGVIARVSNINLLTKQYNFYAKQGRNAAINKIDFLVDKTFAGETTINYFISTSGSNLTGSAALTGTNVLEMFPYPDFPYEKDATRLWRPVYFDGVGEVIQMEFFMSDEQMTTVEFDEEGDRIAPALENFELHSMVIYAMPTSRLQ